MSKSSKLERSISMAVLFSMVIQLSATPTLAAPKKGKAPANDEAKIAEVKARLKQIQSERAAMEIMLKGTGKSTMTLTLDKSDATEIKKQSEACARKTNDARVECFKSAMEQNAKDGRKSWEKSMRGTHPVAQVLVSQMCASKGDPKTNNYKNWGEAFEAESKCTSDNLKTLVSEADSWLDPKNLSKENFGKFQMEKADHWTLKLYDDEWEKTCPDNAGYDCYKKILKRVKGELATSAADWRDHRSEWFKNNNLAYQCYQATMNDKCAEMDGWLKAYYPQWYEKDPEAMTALMDVKYKPRATSAVAKGDGKGKGAGSEGGNSGQFAVNTGDQSGTGFVGGKGTVKAASLVDGEGKGRSAVKGDDQEGKGGNSTERRRGGKDGVGKGEVCEDGVDCDSLAQIEVSDPADLGYDNVYECPSFLKDYNCLTCAAGSGTAGDPSRIAKDKGRHDKICRKELQDWKVGAMKRTAGAGEDYAEGPRGGRAMVGSKKINREIAADIAKLEKVSSFFKANPKTGGEACELLYKDVLGYKDPKTGQPAVPTFSTKEEINLARVDNGNLKDIMKAVGDGLTEDATSQIGAFSVKKQAVTSFMLMAMMDTRILADQKRFEAAKKHFVGDGSVTSCLAPAERDALTVELDSVRFELAAEAADKFEKAESLDKAAEGLHGDHVDGLKKAARREKDLEKGAYVLGMMRTRLKCDRTAVALTGDIVKDLKGDVRPSLAEDWDRSKRKANVEGYDILYRARMEWFDSKFEALTGQKPPSMPKADAGSPDDLKVSCNDLLKMQKTMLGQLDQVRNQFPLLTNVPDSEHEVTKVECTYSPDDRRYGAADPAAGFEHARMNPKSGVPIIKWGINPLAKAINRSGCKRKATLADYLTNADEKPAVLSAHVARSGEAVNKRMLDNLKGVCGPGVNKLAEEGGRVSCMESVAGDFMSCAKTSCPERASLGWVFCRNCSQRNDDAEIKKQEDFLKQVGMTAVMAASIMFTGPTIGARLVQIGAIGAVADMEWGLAKKSRKDEKVALNDFYNGNISWDQYQTALDSKELFGDSLATMTAVNIVFAGMEGAMLVNLLKDYKQGKAVTHLAKLMATSEGKAIYAQARSKNLMSERDIYDFLMKKAGQGSKTHSQLAVDYLDGVKKTLSKQYGKNVDGIFSADDVFRELNQAKVDDLIALAEFERQVAMRVAKGENDPTWAWSVRQKAREALVACGYK